MKKNLGKLSIGFAKLKAKERVYFLPFDEAVFVSVSGSDGRAETLLEPAK